MITAIALVTILSGNVYELETYPIEPNMISARQQLAVCKKKERMLKRCLLSVQRTETKTTYVNMDNWYQFNAYKK